MPRFYGFEDASVNTAFYLYKSTFLSTCRQLRCLAETVHSRCIEAFCGCYMVGDLAGTGGDLAFYGVYRSHEEQLRSKDFAGYAISLKRRLIAESEQWVRVNKELNAARPVTMTKKFSILRTLLHVNISGTNAVHGFALDCVLYLMRSAHTIKYFMV